MSTERSVGPGRAGVRLDCVRAPTPRCALFAIRELKQDNHNAHTDGGRPAILDLMPVKKLKKIYQTFLLKQFSMKIGHSSPVSVKGSSRYLIISYYETACIHILVPGLGLCSI